MQPRQPPKLGDLGERVLRMVPRVEPWRIPLAIVRAPRLTSMSIAIVVYGFMAIIGLGTILLMLPAASETGQSTPFINALFTATSAVCVTGLVVVDTGTHWSSFGQGVILALIQVGGFGIMTGGTFLLLAFGRRVGLREKLLIGQQMGVSKLGGLVPLVMWIMIFTIVVEGLGMVIFYARFSGQYPPATAAWVSVFHSISAFNNAGFDLFGLDLSGNIKGMVDYQGDALMVLGTAALIILGGISFVVVLNIFSARGRSRLSLDTKIVLTTTAALLTLGMVVILITEYGNEDTLGPMSVPQKLLVAFFHSVTPRTAGFALISVGGMAAYSLFFTIMLMFVGGASGSTAGGVKVNTFGVLVTTVWSTVRGSEHAGVFGRQFKTLQIHRALTVVVLSMALVAAVVLALTIVEKDLGFLDILFEAFSAFGTVGLSTGITPELSVAGKAIMTVTMFVGRLGPLTLALSLVQRQQRTVYRYPQDDVRIG